jgi:transcriptional regulator with XRE-family HTH domain
MEGIAYRIKTIRKEFGNLTQAEFAKPLGVTSAHISKIEKGKTTPSESLIKFICKEYGINEAWLINGKEPMETHELEDAIDKKMIYSTKSINKLLKGENHELRLAAAKLNSQFADMVDRDSINSDMLMNYLGMCEQLFKDINKYIEALKLFATEGVITDNTVNTDVLFDKYHKPIETDLKAFIGLFIKNN